MIKKQTENLAKSVFDILKGIMHGEEIIASPEVQSKRKEICNGCEFNDKAQGMCVQCGCILEWKIPASVSECPEGKWDIDEIGVTQHVMKKLDKESENS